MDTDHVGAVAVDVLALRLAGDEHLERELPVGRLHGRGLRTAEDC